MNDSKSPHDLVFLPASELPVLERIRRLSWQAFEDFIAEIYREEGYLVEQTARGRADGGYDLVLLREKTSVLVQCKHWLVYKVSVPRVRELAGAMQKVGATGGVFVTTGAFTKAAREFATGMAIELVDGEALVRRFSRGQEQPAAQVTVPSANEPSCPKCEKPMVWRTARKGPHPGERFWGCPDYPRCKGVRKAA
ncbi:MAG TPA: restriction endonuclease [Candidatus Dormibacteraeota bacterium]